MIVCTVWVETKMYKKVFMSKETKNWKGKEKYPRPFRTCYPIFPIFCPEEESPRFVRCKRLESSTSSRVWGEKKMSRAPSSEKKVEENEQDHVLECTVSHTNVWSCSCFQGSEFVRQEGCMFPLKRRRPTGDVTGLPVLVLHHRCGLLVVPLHDTLFPLIHHILSHKLMDLIDLHLNHLFVLSGLKLVLNHFFLTIHHSRDSYW